MLRYAVLIVCIVALLEAYVGGEEICNNIDGTYNCTCKTGYEGNVTIGFNCTECPINCPKHEVCVRNTIDTSWNCVCEDGFARNNKTCEGWIKKTLIGNQTTITRKKFPRVHNVGKEFKIIFEFLPNGVPAQWRGVAQVDSRRMMLFRVFYNGIDKEIVVEFNTPGFIYSEKAVSSYSMGEWHKVEASHKKIGDQYYLLIDVNGINVVSEVIDAWEKADYVIFYMGGVEDMYPQTGYMRTLILYRKVCPLKCPEHEVCVENVNENAWECICENGFARINKTCGGLQYTYHSTETSWMEAENECQRQGGHLATINSYFQSDYILHEMNSRNWDSTWIGLNDRNVESHFVWSDPERKLSQYRSSSWVKPTYRNVSDADCVVVKKPYEYIDESWQIIPCIDKHYYICQTLGNGHRNASTTMKTYGWIKEILIDHQTKIRRKRFARIDNVGEEFRIVLEFLPNGVPTIPAMVAGAYSRHLIILEVFYDGTSNNIHVRYNRSGEKYTEKIVPQSPMGEWYKVEVTQKKQGNNYYFLIDINGKNIVSNVTEEALQVDFVKFMTGNLYQIWFPQSGYIRKLILYRLELPITTPAATTTETQITTTGLPRTKALTTTIIAATTTETQITTTGLPRTKAPTTTIIGKRGVDRNPDESWKVAVGVVVPLIIIFIIVIVFVWWMKQGNNLLVTRPALSEPRRVSQRQNPLCDAVADPVYEEVGPNSPDYELNEVKLQNDSSNQEPREGHYDNNGFQ